MERWHYLKVASLSGELQMPAMVISKSYQPQTKHEPLEKQNLQKTCHAEGMYSRYKTLSVSLLEVHISISLMMSKKHITRTYLTGYKNKQQIKCQQQGKKNHADFTFMDTIHTHNQGQIRCMTMRENHCKFINYERSANSSSQKRGNSWPYRKIFIFSKEKIHFSYHQSSLHPKKSNINHIVHA